MVGTLRAASAASKKILADAAHSVPTKKTYKTKAIMKKTYMSPSVEVIKVDVATVMATSMGLSDSTVDTSMDDVQLVREIQSLNQWSW